MQFFTFFEFFLDVLFINGARKKNKKNFGLHKLML